MSANGGTLLFQSNRNGHPMAWLLDVSAGKESPAAANPQEQIRPLISPDGSKVAYSESRMHGYEHFYKPAAGGPTEVLCDDCGPVISGWSADSRTVLIDSISGVRKRLSVASIDIGARRKTILIEDARFDVHQASFSPDGRWIAFIALSDNGGSRLYITPSSEKPPVALERWIALTDGSSWETTPQWSPDGKLVYYWSARDGHRCIWAQRLDATGKPSGAALPVYHFHTARRSPAQVAFSGMDLFVARDQILVSVGELTGSIWSAKVPN
jgi:Tol biopolymer transport system component